MGRPITSLTGYFKKIEQIKKSNSKSLVVYRGQSKKSYNFTPSLFRSSNLQRSEHLIIRRLLAEHPREFKDDESTFEHLVQAQHYGLPTRLMDVSNNPLVALYFATKSTKGENGRVFVISPNLRNQKYFDSDSVSCVSNLCYLKAGEKREVITNIRDALSVAVSKAGKTATSVHTGPAVEHFNRQPVVDRLIQFIKKEKPHFRNQIDPLDLYRIFSVVPRKLNSRIAAQDGAFLIFGLIDNKQMENISSSSEVLGEIKTEFVEIDWKAKEKIRNELDLVGISEATLFPEIEKSALQIKKNYS